MTSSKNAISWRAPGRPEKTAAARSVCGYDQAPRVGAGYSFCLGSNGGSQMSSCYPIDGEVVCANRVPRWRPLVNWILTAPLLLWLAVLQFGAFVVTFLGWFAILFNEQLPQRFGDYLVAVLRYEWRVGSYLLGLTDRYPGWRVVAGYGIRAIIPRCFTVPAHQDATAPRSSSEGGW